MGRILSLRLAIPACLAGAAGSIAFAFAGDRAAGSIMAKSGPQALVLLAALLVAAVAIRSLIRRRWASALLHGGFAIIAAGWLIGQNTESRATADLPASGNMALADGDTSDTLYTGDRLQNFAGRVPFTLTLDKFTVTRYGAAEDSPVRDYSSRVTFRQTGRPDREADIRVNHPARIAGYYIYQMSWGQTLDNVTGEPVTYTILSFIRDPGLPVVYAGFLLLAGGALLFAVRQFRLT